jgi:hypothetical protein
MIQSKEIVTKNTEFDPAGKYPNRLAPQHQERHSNERQGVGRVRMDNIIPLA